MRAEQTLWLRRSVLLANALALLGGLVLVVPAAWRSSSTVLWTVVGVIGGALVSATVVTFTLGGISLNETIVQVDSALLRGLQSSSTRSVSRWSPVRSPATAGTAGSAVRWRTTLSRTMPIRRFASPTASTTSRPQSASCVRHPRGPHP
jgi:hypothetical protein